MNSSVQKVPKIPVIHKVVCHAFSTRSIRPAAKFCAIKALSAVEKPWEVFQVIASICPPVVSALFGGGAAEEHVDKRK